MRGPINSTTIYSQDRTELFEALRQLGTSPEATLFSHGILYVEGDDDIAILEASLPEIVASYNLRSLGGRSGVEKQIRTLQGEEAKAGLDTVHCFVFDRDRRPTGLESTDKVKVVQWDRYCIENYLLNAKALFDEILGCAKAPPANRGEFANSLQELALTQLGPLVARQVYSELEPENPGMRSDDVEPSDYETVGEVMANRLESIRTALTDFDTEAWQTDFVQRCQAAEERHRETWAREWHKLCSGKRLLDALYQRYEIRIAKSEFKARIAKRQRDERAEEWLVLKGILNEAIPLSA